GIGEISLASPLQSRRRSIRQPGTVSKNRRLSKSSKTAKLAEERKRGAIQTAELAEEASKDAVLRQSDQVGAKFQGNSLRIQCTVSKTQTLGSASCKKQRFCTGSKPFLEPNFGHISMLTTDPATERRAECRLSPGERKQLASNQVTG